MKSWTKIVSLVMVVIYTLSINHMLCQHALSHEQSCCSMETENHHSSQCCSHKDTRCYICHHHPDSHSDCNWQQEYIPSVRSNTSPTQKILLQANSIITFGDLDTLSLKASIVTAFDYSNSIEAVVCPYLLSSNSPNSPPYNY